MTEKQKLVAIGDVLSSRQDEIHSDRVNLKNVKVQDHSTLMYAGKEIRIPSHSQRLDSSPVRQLCHAIGMSPSFYMANSSTLNTEIFESRFAGLEDSEASRILRYRETKEGNVLLSILPMAHEMVGYSDIVEPLIDVLPDNIAIRLSNHESVDFEHRFSMRISLLDYPVVMKNLNKDEPCEFGLFIDMSEDGVGGHMKLTTMLYNQICTNGAMISYDSNPYFEYNYRGIKAVDLKAAVQSSIKRLGADVELLQTKIQESDQIILSKAQAIGWLKGMESRRDVSLGFLRKVRNEIENKEIETISQWRVINALTYAAQSLPYDGRVKHEFFAGALLNLDLQEAA
jgi:hypothetical protein